MIKFIATIIMFYVASLYPPIFVGLYVYYV